MKRELSGGITARFLNNNSVSDDTGMISIQVDSGAALKCPYPPSSMNWFQSAFVGFLSGVQSIQPPVVNRVLPLLVPKTDVDGNEMGGIPSPLHQAPLGSYLGWNVTRSGVLKGRSCQNSGGFLPFARTKAERLASGDPRLSLEERYRDHTAYLEAVKAAVNHLSQGRFLLADDAARLIRQAEESKVMR